MKLIVNADDFGVSETVTEKIVFCHQNGIVSSTTLLAGGGYFEGAVQLAKENPKLGVGVHLALDGPLNVGKKSSALLNPKTGTFYEDLEVIKKIRAGAFPLNELISEYSQQIEKVRNQGITITHLDHHHHFHLYFPVLKAMIHVANHYKIPFIRSQKLIFASHQSLLKKIYRAYHQYYLAKNYATIAGYSSLIGCNPEEMHAKLENILSLNRKTVELVVHPLETNGEIDFLTHPKVVEKSKNHLINFADLAKK